MTSLPAALAPVLDSLDGPPGPLGLYLHIPFCRDRCTYCSFVTTRDWDLKAGVLARLGQDLAAWGSALDRPAVDTLYLGGGTPSILSLDELGALVGAAREAFDLGPLEEATLEANPGTVDLPWLEGARALGFDRLSLGVQALDDELLGHLGRIHGAAQALEAIVLARQAGFRRLSADLMVGIPGQKLERVLADARTLVEAGCDHLSVYLLDLDKACPLKAQVDAGRLVLPDEDAVADIFEALQVELPRLGLPPYEISNYARPGQESRHNGRYWVRRPYLGLGPSAASHLGRWRWTESGVLPAWVEGRGTFDLTELDPAEDLAEMPLLGLRRHDGIDWEALRALAAQRNLLPLVDAWERHLEPYLRHDLLRREGPRMHLTSRGMLLSNPILSVFA